MIILTPPLHVLIVEDSEDDTLLLVHELRKGGFEPIYKRVDNRNALEKALKNDHWEIILADYKLPQPIGEEEFSGVEVFKVLQASGKDIPLILVSGIIYDGDAVELLKMGAKDYVRKDNLARLIPAINRELNVSVMKTEHKEMSHILSEESHRKEFDAENCFGLTNIDDIDLKIIEMLTLNGREKFVDIANLISKKGEQSISHVGVNRRLKKLMDRDILKIQANLNLNKLNFVLGLILLETIDQMKVNQLIEKFKNCPRVIFCFRSSSKYDLIFGVIAENIKTLESFINTCSPKTDPNVRDSNVFISTSFFQPRYFPVTILTTAQLDSTPCGTDCNKCSFYKDKKCFGCPAHNRCVTHFKLNK